jgi:hypothetical protein
MSVASMESENAAHPVIGEIGTFLIATAEVLRETIMRFEKTTAGITEHVMTRPSQADRDLIVTLQDFDRLQQEFLMLAEVLTQAAGKSGESWLRAEGGGHPAEDAIAGISVADLKERLMRYLNISMVPLAPAAGEVAEF